MTQGVSAIRPIPVPFETPEQASPFPYMMQGLQTGSNVLSQLYQNQFTQAQAQKLQQQMPYVGPTAAATLQNSILTNQGLEAGLPYIGQQAAANVAQTRAQIPVMQATASELNARTPLEQAQTALANKQAQMYGMQFLDPVSQMLASRTILLPQMMSQNGGMTMMPTGNGQAQQQPLGASFQQAQPPIDQYPMLTKAIMQTGVPFRYPNQNASPQIMQPGQQQLPGGLSATQGQALANTLASGAGMPIGQPNSMQMPQLAPQIMPQQQTMPNQMSAGGMPTGMPDVNTMYGLQMRNAMMSYGKNPAFGSQRSGAGGTYLDPSTGESFSSPTSANTTYAQRTITSLQKVQPLLSQLSNNLGQFQTLGGDASLGWSRARNYVFGADTKPANDYAVGQAALQTAPESLLRGWNLNVTNESLERMQKAVEPVFGESQVGYQKRIVGTLKQLQDMQAQAQQQLLQGVPLNADQMPVNPNQQWQTVTPSPSLPTGTKNLSDADWQYSAKKYGIPVEQLKSIYAQGGQ